jgi:hypothetical protein
MYPFRFFDLSFVLVFLLLFVLVPWLFYRILPKTGLSARWAWLAPIPIVNLVALWVLAFVNWPSRPTPPDHRSSTKKVTTIAAAVVLLAGSLYFLFKSEGDDYSITISGGGRIATTSSHQHWARAEEARAEDYEWSFDLGLSSVFLFLVVLFPPATGQAAASDSSSPRASNDE